MFSITDKAVAQIKKIAEDEEIGHTIVRVGIKGGSCAGFSHDVFYEDRPINESDEVFEKDGVKIVIDPVSLTYMENATMDFSDGLMGQGFRFTNPDATGSCGCGKSFSM